MQGKPRGCRRKTGDSQGRGGSRLPFLWWTRALMDSRIPTLFGGIGRDGGRGSPALNLAIRFASSALGFPGRDSAFKWGCMPHSPAA